jgi:hypothetical protein
LRTAENDDQTIYHKIFYDKIHAGWYDFIFLYHRLISEIKSRYQINYEIVFQKTPSVIFHLPNNYLIKAYRRLGNDYNDIVREKIPFNKSAFYCFNKGMSVRFTNLIAEILS